MQPSIFNVRVPLPERNEVFLMNTLNDAQLVVSPEVTELLDRSANGGSLSPVSDDEREALDLLSENGFLVPDRDFDRRALDKYFASVKNDTAELNVTLLTTLQCNFACDYCFQGDHGDYNKFADKMTLQTAEKVADWIENELARVRPEKFVLTFFGGEPLLNLPVMYYLAEELWGRTQLRGVPMSISVITNGLLLTPEVVDRLLPYGLRGIKITLDGDRDTHNRMRPLRGGQATFDRLIENIRSVAGRTSIAIGGNFDESSADSFSGLIDFLSQQDFADKLVNVNFKPIVRTENSPKVSATLAVKGMLPLIPVGANGKPLKHPLNGACMSNVGEGSGVGCDSCGFLDDKMALLREQTKRHGFHTPDGVHGGPCHVHHTHAHTIGPDGSLYACPGFTGEKAMSTGHIDGRRDARRESAIEQFERLHPWDECQDCAFIPTCAGGCLVASHTQLGDMNKPTCHKQSFESALISLAHDVASAA
ncbi:MAG: radical SAM protein [Vicinamibacterales bacterium]|nr:radical SAM protein [Vicinamibacterales bacterium]